MSDEKTKSDLAEAIEANGRYELAVELDGFFGFANKPIHRAIVRVPTKKLEDDAVVAAHKYMVERETNDDDILEDAKGIEIVWRCFYDANDPRYPAFPSPGWMRSHITGPQLAGLLIHVAEAKEASCA